MPYRGGITLRHGTQIKRNLYTFFRALMRPNDWLCEIGKKKILWRIISISGLFIMVGIALEKKWPFPHFFKFVFGFLFIGILTLWSIVYFSKKITSIVATIANQPGAKRANYFYHLHCTDSPLFVLCPLVIAFVFGVGGCSMFGAMSFNPTLIWVLVLFFVVVYISIIGYLQYIVLAIYIWNLANGSGRYRKLPKSMVECIPAELDWLQDLTKLSHTYRSSFFTLGSSYIIAFGAFCYLPEMQASTSSPVFYILWGTILVVIVLLFPVASILEYCWIKRIVGHLKASYIEDLETESIISRKNATIVLAPAIERFTKTLCALQIINSRDYPLKSIWATCYAAVLSVFNLSAALATISQVVPTLSIALRQIF